MTSVTAPMVISTPVTPSSMDKIMTAKTVGEEVNIWDEKQVLEFSTPS